MALDGYNEHRITRQAMKSEMLDAETELALARAWRDHRDEAALHRLVQRFTPLKMWHSLFQTVAVKLTPQVVRKF